jgi:DNA repair exonuclease SbcCD ATPase subunit
MESMKADMARVESRRAEMVELETQYGRVKRLEDELGQKIARFIAEKRRFDAMEDDFKRLIILSQGVDQKLAAVTASNDQLTQIQAEVRRLSEASDEAGEKYERLEKKSNILDATTDAIDKNFQAVTELERNVRTIDADIREIPDRVIDLKRSLDEVAAWKPKLDAAVVRLDEVDATLADAEKRAAELQKAREWLARAETRFDELNKKTQEHLKLLNDILKDDPKSKGKDKGAPSLSVQETVRKLAHQGWKVEEIARAVKLSRGEVELILELGGQD